MTDERVATILDRLRAHGGRVTATRRLVIEAMVASPDHHLTAPEVVAAVRATDPGFYESTVYRTLDRLVALGVVRQLHLGAGGAVYHLSADPHHHLVCVECGQVTHIPAAAFDALRARLERDHGFRLDDEHTSISGTCQVCRERHR